LGVLVAALKEGPTHLAALAERTTLYDVARPKTLQRDIAALRSLGYKIAVQRGRYELIDQPVELNLSDEEARVLAALRAAFPPGHPNHPAVETLMARLEQHLPPSAVAILDEPPPLRMALTPATDYEPHAATLRTLERAVRRNLRVELEYESLERPRRRYAALDPLDLRFVYGHFYFEGYFREIEQSLEFRVDRITPGSVRLRPDRAAPRPRRALAFTYRLAARIARRGVSERFANQGVEVQDDGSALVHAEGTSAFRIIQELLRYGEQAELLAPEWLRAEMARTVERMMGLYRDEAILPGSWRPPGE
ncbi:MAG TPA: WYL domain-containing protein, partial [Ardenticatenaceae bacterium]|nr:WYL domain-containing protein [Ardenticatenaceae bacterium]